MTRHRTGIALVVAATGSWALGSLLTKVVLDRAAMAPATLLAAQLLVSVAAMTAWTAHRGQLPPRGRSTWRHGLAGLLEPGLSFQLSVAGLALTSAGHAALIGSLEPVLVPFGTWLVWRRRPTRGVAVLTLVVAAGTVLLVQGRTGGGALTGDLLVLGGTASAAAYVVSSARSVTHLPPVTVALMQQVVALVVALAVALVVAAVRAPLVIDPDSQVWMLLVVSGLLHVALPFPLYLASLARLDAPVAAQYLALIPLFGFSGAVLWLGEPVTATQLAGAATVIIALAAAGGAASVGARRGELAS